MPDKSSLPNLSMQESNPQIIPDAFDSEHSSYPDLTDDEKIDIVAARILKRFKPAFEELAK